jgi:hypothetical protein
MKASRLNGRTGRAIIKSFFGSIALLLNQKMVKLGAKFVGACLPDRQERIIRERRGMTTSCKYLKASRGIGESE